MDWIADSGSWFGLLTLTALEIVLGIDNIVFISILAGRLPPEQQGRARMIGLGLAMGMRILLLRMLAWLADLKEPLFTLPLMGKDLSGRDLVLLAGGLFLIAKATREIHHSMESPHGAVPRAAPSFASVITQIVLIDVVFSVDSVITAIGMADEIGVMVTAVIVAVVVMMLAAKSISAFVERHPTVKMLALSFLLLIGMSLLADGLGLHIPKGYIYFAMAFSVAVEMLNQRVARKRGGGEGGDRAAREEGQG